jgi:hypothetical protein
MRVRAAGKDFERLRRSELGTFFVVSTGTGQRGFGMLETIIAAGIVAGFVLVAFGVLTFETVQLRGRGAHSEAVSEVEAALVRADAGARYTKSPETFFAPAALTITPAPAPSGALAVVPAMQSLTATTMTTTNGTPQLVLIGQPGMGSGVTGAIDLVKAIPVRGESTIVASPSPVPQP